MSPPFTYATMRTCVCAGVVGSGWVGSISLARMAVPRPSEQSWGCGAGAKLWPGNLCLCSHQTRSGPLPRMVKPDPRSEARCMVVVRRTASVDSF